MAELKKVIGYKALLLIIINSILGTGIFFLPAAGAQVAGAASLFSWAIMSVFAIYISMNFAELCSMFPSAGGTYEFCKQSYGKFTSFLVGWLTLIGGNITIAMLIIGAISYLLPADMPQIEIIIMSISALFILIFNVIAYRGMKTSATMLVTFSGVTLVTLAAIMIPSVIRFDTSNFELLLTNNKTLIFLAIFFIAETFFGWESPTFLAGETKNGEKVVPKAMIRGTIIICIISFVFVLLAMGSIGPEKLGASGAPVSDIAQFHFGDIGRKIFMVLTYLAIIGSVADWVVSAPRLILSMAKDKLFLPQLAHVHKKFQTPHRAIVFQSILSIAFVFLGLGSYTTLMHMLVPILLISYSFVMMSVVVLRHKKPNLRRYYKAPFGKVGPIIVVIFFMGLLITWLNLTHDATRILFKVFALILFGIPIYALLKMYYDPKAIRFLDDILAYFTLMTERFAVPIGVRKNIIRMVGNVKGKNVLEFGCSVGTLTMHLAEEVGKKGKVYATDISEKEANIARKRVKKKGHNHVQILHDLNHSVRVHPEVPEVHTVVSIGSLGYIQEVDKVLKHMNVRLKKNAKICFVDYDKLFGFIPNAEWLSSDDKIKKVFKRNGFEISVMRKRGFLWNYVYIYGVKNKN